MKGRSRQAAYELACDQWDAMTVADRIHEAELMRFQDVLTHEVDHDGSPIQAAWLEKRTEELMEDDDPDQAFEQAGDR